LANEVKITISSRDRTKAGVASAKHSIADLGDAAKRTGRDVDGLGKETQSVGRRVANSVAGMVSNFGNIGASIVGSGGPVAAVAALGAVIATLPMIATAAGAGIGLGLGAGIAGIGIAIAAQNEQVKRSFSGLKDHALASLRDMATPFEGVLIRLAHQAASAFDQLGPHISSAFAKAAPAVEKLAAAIIGSLGNLGPFIGRVVAAFDPLAAVLAQRLPGMIGNLTNQLARMAEAVDPRAFDQLLGGINGLVTGTSNLIIFLERLAGAFAALEGKSQTSVRAQEQQKDVWRQIGEAIGVVNPQVSQLTTLNNGATQSWLGLGNATQQAAARLREWHSAVLASYNAEIGLEQAIDDANKTIKDNGRTLDVNTQKGRDNKRALLGIAAEALRAAEAAKKSGASTSAAMNRGYNSFVRAARGAGLTTRQARALARQIGLVPTKRSTTFRTNASSAAARVAHLQRMMNNIPRHIASTIAVNLAYSGLSQNVARKNRAHGGIIGAQGGGPRSRQTLVGEQGPEIVDLAPGSMVRSNPDTRRILSQGGGGMQGPVYINLVVDGKVLAQALYDPLRGLVRNKGGKGPASVQKALGWS
jgi:hypothetical protein